MHRSFRILRIVAAAAAGAVLASCSHSSSSPTQPANQQWSADPAIAFTYIVTTGSSLNQTNTYYLAVMNADGSNRTVIDSSTAEDPYAPNWSPNGKRLAFLNQMPDGSFRLQTCGVALVNGVPTIQNRTTLVDSINPSYGDPAWNPNPSAAEIAYINNGTTVQVIPAAGGAAKTLYAAPSGFHIQGGPSYSPDGLLLAFDVENSTGVGDTIKVVDSTGAVKGSCDVSVVVQLGGLGELQWGHAPGDTKIAFGVEFNNGFGVISTVDYANFSASPVQVLGSANINAAGCCTWSPDDSKLLFEGDSPIAGNDNFFTFNTVALASGTVTPLDTVACTMHQIGFDWRR